MPKAKSIEEWLKALEQNEMLDDHGPVIVGDRKRKPIHPEPSPPAKCAELGEG